MGENAAPYAPITIREAEDHLDILHANRLIRDYGWEDGSFWVQLNSGHNIVLAEEAVEGFARGVAYAVQYLGPLNESQRFEMARYNAILRSL
jgi:hypothetical protein